MQSLWLAIADLQRLPTARAFPPGFPAKRSRGGAAHFQLAGGKGAPAALVPTACLLQLAAHQLTQHVKQRRVLRAARRAGHLPGAHAPASCSSSSGGSSDSEAEDGSVRGPRHLLQQDPRQLCSGGLQAWGSSHDASTSLAASSSLPDSGDTSLGLKRVCLERQSAIDLAGVCLMGTERLPLPEPAEVAW